MDLPLKRQPGWGQLSSEPLPPPRSTWSPRAPPRAALLSPASPHLAVAAAAAALGHALDLPGQGLVHEVRQRLFAEQAGPELDGEGLAAGKRGKSYRKSC